MHSLTPASVASNMSHSAPCPSAGCRHLPRVACFCSKGPVTVLVHVLIRFRAKIMGAIHSHSSRKGGQTLGIHRCRILSFLPGPNGTAVEYIGIPESLLSRAREVAEFEDRGEPIQARNDARQGAAPLTLASPEVGWLQSTVVWSC